MVKTMNIHIYRHSYIYAFSIGTVGYRLLNYSIIYIGLTLTSLRVKISLLKVLFTTAGLFFTLGKITPPFRTTDFVGIAFHEEVVGDVGRVVLTSILFVLVLEEIG